MLGVYSVGVLQYLIHNWKIFNNKWKFDLFSQNHSFINIKGEFSDTTNKLISIFHNKPSIVCEHLSCSATILATWWFTSSISWFCSSGLYTASDISTRNPSVRNRLYFYLKCYRLLYFIVTVVSILL